MSLVKQWCKVQQHCFELYDWPWLTVDVWSLTGGDWCSGRALVECWLLLVALVAWNNNVRFLNVTGSISSWAVGTETMKKHHVNQNGKNDGTNNPQLTSNVENKKTPKTRTIEKELRLSSRPFFLVNLCPAGLHWLQIRDSPPGPSRGTVMKEKQFIGASLVQQQQLVSTFDPIPPLGLVLAVFPCQLVFCRGALAVPWR